MSGFTGCVCRGVNHLKCVGFSRCVKGLVCSGKCVRMSPGAYAGGMNCWKCAEFSRCMIWWIGSWHSVSIVLGVICMLVCVQLKMCDC